MLNEQKSALGYLWHIAEQQEYYNRLSHSCVKDFKETFPKQTVRTFVNNTVLEKPTFVKDEFVWDGKIYGGSREI